MVSFACISCDRVTKDLAKERLKNQPPVSYFHDTVRLEYVENTGAALSLGDNLPKSVSFWLLSIFYRCHFYYCYLLTPLRMLQKWAL